VAGLVPLRPHLPWHRFPGLARDLIRRQPRSFLGDCRAMLDHIEVSWEGGDNLPDTGPLCVIANHYQRRDLWIGWTGALISVAVAERRRGQVPSWLVLGDLPIRVGRLQLSLPGAAWAFSGVADIWGLIPTTGFANPIDRAQPLRRVIRILRGGGVVGLFPEGASGTVGRLGPLAAGSGRFLLRLERQGVSIVPAGVRECHGQLIVRFGPPITGWPSVAADREQDRCLGDFVLRHIAGCLELPAVETST
jgi:1-acyl-sn-glycerol-3-phosphate acyltransferase